MRSAIIIYYNLKLIQYLWCCFIFRLIIIRRNNYYEVDQVLEWLIWCDMLITKISMWNLNKNKKLPTNRLGDWVVSLVSFYFWNLMTNQSYLFVLIICFFFVFLIKLMVFWFISFEMNYGHYNQTNKKLFLEQKFISIVSYDS